MNDSAETEEILTCPVSRFFFFFFFFFLLLRGLKFQKVYDTSINP